MMEGVRSEMSRRVGDFVRRLHRFTDSPMTRKKLIIICLVAVFFILYAGPTIVRWIFGGSGALSHQDLCQKRFLSPFEKDLDNYDAYLRFDSNAPPTSHNYVPYVGNGLVGLALEHDSHLNIKYGRTISIPVNYHPLYVLKDNVKELTLTEYKNGIVNRLQCSSRGIQAQYKYYAHRTIPSLFVQEILVTNPTKKTQSFEMKTTRVSYWPLSNQKPINLHQGSGSKEYEIVTGMISMPDSDKVIALSVVTRKLSPTHEIQAGESMHLLVFTTLHFSIPIKKEIYENQKDIVEKKAIDEMMKVIALTSDKAAELQLRENHSRVWQGLWDTGFYISDSKASGVINGDRINATIYAILSQVRSYEHEADVLPEKKADILKTLTYSEGCYEGHSTLGAFNLWKPLNSLEMLNTVASNWLLTLEKQGCHNLLKAGASGVNQAVILSFGSLRFSNQHLEYNIHPLELHRDFLFRRLNYGIKTHVNISVILQEDNKAAIFVALDRSDKTYYACDAGCLDPPVQLGQYRKYFPVKLTEPLTAILYVTADKQHMEDLRHAIHVKEVVEAPAHEHHVIALHKHGHSLGGINPMFWVSIVLIIVVFHLFLCRIVMNEFCDNGSSGISYRRRPKIERFMP